MHPALKHAVIAAGFRLISATRADRWLAPAARGRGMILMFHHVRPARDEPFQPNKLLEITPEHLDRTLALVHRLGFDLVGMDAIPDRLRRPDGHPFVVLTFDDGYRDNVEHAQPVLRRHGAPWTMFVTADYASGQGHLWWLELEEVVRRSDRIVLDDRKWSARNLSEKTAAFSAVYASLRAGPEDRLRRQIALWCGELGIDGTALVRELCLGWDELADLARDPAVTIGAHTLTHPMLAKHDDETARREIEGGRSAIANQLGIGARHLAYPVGDPTSAGRRDFDLAKRAGYETAVTTRPGHLFAEHASALDALPRVSVNGLYQTESAARALLSGVPFLLWNRGRRVSSV